MNTNEYYILPKNRIRMVTHTDVVGDEESLRWSIDKQEFLIKTKEGIKNSGALTPFTPMNQEEIKTYLNNPVNGFIEIEN